MDGRVFRAALAVALVMSTSSAASRTSLGTATRRLLDEHALERLALGDSVQAVRRLQQIALHDPTQARSVHIAVAELSLRAAERAGKTDPVAGLYVSAARHAWEAQAVSLYNKAVSRLIGELEAGVRAAVWGADGEYLLELDRRSFDRFDPRDFRLIPADRVRIRGVSRRHRSPGVGAPLVVARRDPPAVPLPIDGFHASYEDYAPLTAVLRFDASTAGSVHAVLSLQDPSSQPDIDIDGRRHTLSADHTAHLVVLVDAVDTTGQGLAGLFRARRFIDETGLYLVEPYRPRKIPVILVHGLQSTAVTWAEMVNELRADPRIRERFQFWAFNYPTGLPWDYSAMLLRRSLTRTRLRLDPQNDHAPLERAVIVGHSMGGLLARLQATSSGTVLWDTLFNRPLEQLNLDPADAAILRELYLIEPWSPIDRAVFLSTPHGGARIVTGRMVRAGSILVRRPSELTAIAERIIARNPGALVADAADRLRNTDSVEALSPQDAFLEALGTLPMESSVPYHSIIGDRDTVVTYSSAHIEGAASELLVPSRHDSHMHPAAIAEVRRILLEHLDSDD